MRLGSLVGLVVAGLLVFAAPASATFHLMRVAEVYPAGNASYVELALMAPGEYQVGGHHLVIYNVNGTVAEDFTMPSNVSPTSRNNSRILITGPGYSAAFPSGPATNEADANLNLSPSGGALCWVEGSPPDCVAWGNFTGPLPAHTPPLLVGNPASPGGVTAGKALRRSEAANCPTILEEADDTDDSAADFSEQTPSPRDNASPITETDCVTPEAVIDSKPANPTKSTSAGFIFHSQPAGATFECKLDVAPFEVCAPADDTAFEYPGPLADGSHTFQVRAINTQGAGTPASYTWIVDTKAPTATIQSQPANPSSGASAAFSYESSQLGSSFECSLVKQGEAESFASCPAEGQTYAGLADGTYTFQVRATDKAGNRGAATAYTWVVNNSIAVIPPVSLPPVVTIPPVTIPRPPTKPAPLHCKKGFVKKKVGAKTSCVKQKKKKHKH